MKKIIYTIDTIKEVAKEIINYTPNKTICLYGDMAAGKTTLVKAIVEELGVTNVTNSPTFSIVNEYHSNTGEPIAYHFDFYRLNQETEALDIGVEDYLYAGLWTFIEWPDKIKNYLPKETTAVYFKILEDHKRELSIVINM